MDAPSRPPSGYDSVYERFDSPLGQRLRQEAYGDEFGQHSWTTAVELTTIARHLRLDAGGHLLDLGCGPGGPLVQLVGSCGCAAVGIDVSPRAIASAHSRARDAGLLGRLDLRVSDCDQPLPFADRGFSAVLALDTVLHLRDRAATFREVRRLLRPGGRFVYTDAGVLTGAVSAPELQRRSPHGATHFVPAGWNERILEASGLRGLATEDRTEGLLTTARGRLAARAAHRDELLQLDGRDAFAAENCYLETVVAMAERGALTRWLFVAERSDS